MADALHVPKHKEHERNDGQAFQDRRIPTRLVVRDEDDEVHGDRFEERHKLRANALDLQFNFQKKQ